MARKTQQIDPVGPDGVVIPMKTGASNALTIKEQHLKKVSGLTATQHKFFDEWDKGNYFMTLSGSAGTGKSYIALSAALKDVLDRSTPYDKVVIVRSAVQSRDIGFTPGTLDEKSALYSIPYEQICSSLFNRPDAYKRLVEQKKIEFVLTSFLRGTSFDRSIVIFDEAQNSSFLELNTVITRIGIDSKVIVIGDTQQDDLTYKRKEVSGLTKYLSIANTMDCHVNITFTVDDIVRSGLVKDWIMAVENHHHNHQESHYD